MFTTFSQNAILAKIKAMYGKRITPSQYGEMLHKTSLSELAAYLKNSTRYQDAMDTVNPAALHRGQLEATVKKELFYSLLRLVRYLPGRREREQYVSFFIGQIEMDQLIGCINRLDAEGETHFVPEVPAFLLDYLSFDAVALGQAETGRELLELLEKTPYYKTVEPFALAPGEFDVSSCVTALRQQYYNRLFSLIEETYKGKTRQEMMDIVSTSLELQNITNLYRLKVYFHYKPEELDRFIVHNEYSRLSDRFLQSLAAAPNGDAFIREIAQSSYKNYFDKDDFLYIEYHTSYIKYHLSRRHISFATKAATAFLAYVTLGTVECDNIIHIVEGIRYGVQPEDIQKLLII
ncbi:V0D/AC39 family V-type ATPase subunit [Bittarella massiliensis (ex Durand et al. 2017)]|uniref:V0D/AC39 family V-type ATPase subunit n=1 Tax=Bittarella massiliensis (ex Durand et al. 2017) TaxID=1720313 RepID=UPI001AA0C5E2|nr:V-type ATPase subunit [Bittarella massiliensis (ex Durand et al. 2017)]MBO1679989.1 V-type ATPase subunit [Bittarella massiliensis (ex Durand et al. 2017)]